MDYEILCEYVERLEAFKEFHLEEKDKERIVSHIVTLIQQGSAKLGDHLNNHVRSLVALFAEYQPPADQRIVAKLSADTLTTSAFLADKIAPWVETVRTEIFGSPQPPFPTIKEAASYLKGVAQEKDPQAEIDLEIYHQGMVDFEMSMAVCKVNSSSFSYGAGYGQFLEYIREDGQIGVVKYRYPIPQNWTVPQMRQSAHDFPVLPWLGNEVRLMAKATGFDEHAVVAYILCGIEPLLQRWRLTGRQGFQRSPSGETLRPVSLNLEIKTKDITFEELRGIYQSIRKGMKAKRTDPLNKRHLWLYQTVKEKGGPKKKGEKGKVAFWQSIMEAANEEFKDHWGFEPWGSWKAVKIAYNRLIKRLESAHSSTEIPLTEVSPKGGAGKVTKTKAKNQEQ